MRRRRVCERLSGPGGDGGDGCTLAGPSTSCGEAECGPGSAVSPSGALWFTPVKYLNPGALQSWPLPSSL
ncbi:hypothetical protein [Nannocystis bainbridge]|uniref:Uncharacterized protein n=1 Tax=Nannocystis bainbridge TaxID=2995303 RepID=A0ABT5EBC3_9BACT|nr:hypothetical protein [Nannocystis bainbridge]MDC0722728.1 hypothetical protein [Nannocystis bainbridge]